MEILSVLKAEKETGFLMGIVFFLKASSNIFSEDKPGIQSL